MAYPWQSATHDYAARMLAQVESGANASVAWALLIADTLGIAADPNVPPETRDAHLDLAVTWAGQRRLAGLIEMVVDAYPPVPDDASELDAPLHYNENRSRYHQTSTCPASEPDAAATRGPDPESRPRPRQSDPPAPRIGCRSASPLGR